MNKLSIQRILKNNAGRLYAKVFLSIVLMSGILTSCELNDEFKIAMSGPLTVSTSKSSLVLNQKEAANSAVSFNWTTGTNEGSGASISYLLQVDKKGNGFAKPMAINMGKGVYTKDFTTSALNDSLLKHWGLAPNTAVQLEARVIATVFTDPVSTNTSNVFTVSVTPYQPVSKTLYLIGDASPKGWSVDNALALTPSDNDPTIFVYQGALSAGDLKFITTSGQLLPSYNKGADDQHIVYRTIASQPDNKFTVAEASVYKVTVSLLDLTISIVKMDLPPYSTIYMVGDATPNGWDISNSTLLKQSTSNPYIFTYTGVMTAGDFKFPVNRNSDWGQDMYMKVDDTHMYLHHGGTSGDDKWTIAKKGYYTITLNLIDNSISLDRLKLYMVGSATPIGWTIGSAIELTEDATDGCIFTYAGPMVAGEFKFPVNRNTDWGQDMYMKTDDTHMYRHIGGASDDNKWTLTSAGNYAIAANVETLSISIQRQ